MGIHRSFQPFLPFENVIISLWIWTGNRRSSKCILNWSQTEVPVPHAESSPTPSLSLLLTPHPWALLIGLSPLTPRHLHLPVKGLVWVATCPPLDDGSCLLPNSLPPANPVLVLLHMALGKSFLEPKPVHVTPPPKPSATSPESPNHPCRLTGLLGSAPAALNSSIS